MLAWMMLGGVLQASTFALSFGGSTLNRWLMLSCVVLASSIMSIAQSAPTSSTASTWDVFVGGNLQRGVANNIGGNFNYFGWDAAVSERPYRSHPWIGGTVEASGSYRNTASTVSGVSANVDDGVYTMMGGPVVASSSQHLRPFAHVLLGGIFDRTSVSLGGQSATTVSTQCFGTAFGGGVDVSLAPRVALRGQADWLRFWASDLQSSNLIRASVGAVFRF